MSHDGFNQTPAWKSIIAVPISTSTSQGRQGRRGPTVVELPGGSAGFPKASFALCHQVTTLDRSKLTRKAGALSSELLREIEGALKAAMDLE
jgi:mRNA-degrading endonuclease toxin of MazEF toxin-antitoxin module